MMIKRRISAFLLALSLIVISAAAIVAQDPAASPQQPAAAQPTDEEQKAKDAADKKAVALLDQVVAEGQMLKLPENRIRVQIAAADLLWERNESRARGLFSLAGEGVAEMMRSTEGNAQRWAAQLRQEVVLTAAQHDATLAYSLLAQTRSLTPATDNNANNFRRPNADANLDQTLLARVASIDPKLAAQKVEEALAKGQYPSTIGQVIASLLTQDKDAATKLTSKVVSKLQSENMLSNVEAENLALSLLRPGPRSAQSAANDAPAPANKPSATQPAATPTNANAAGAPVLPESSFQDLMNTIIDAALRATPQPANNQRGPNNRGGGRGNPAGGAQTPDQSTPTDGQIEQQNARRLMQGMSSLLPQIDQYVPARASAVRAKLTELGMGNNPRLAFQQMNDQMQQRTSDNLIAIANAAPPQVAPRFYQQAAQKALDEGNADKARQIATDHLDAGTRDAMLQRVDFQVMAQKMTVDNMDQLRATLAGLHNDDERIDLLLMLSTMAQKTDLKLAAKFLVEAQRLTNRRATSYKQFDQQLKVAQAFATVDPTRSFEVLEPGISQLNELLSAAAMLSGFEVNIFKDGELPMGGGSDLGSTIAQYGQQLAALAKIDFERAQTTAGRFQLPESRVLVQLAMARNVLGVPEASMGNGGFGGRGGPGGPGRRGQ
jgi:hypothetical protein